MYKCWCTKWCCYKDPYDKQCRKIVTKNNKRVRCKRYGKIYHKETNRYYCEMHYNEIVAAEKEEKMNRVSTCTDSSYKRVSMDSCYECSSSD